MIRIPRWPMATTALLLGLMHAGLGIYWSSSYRNQIVGIIAVIFYVGVLSSTMLAFKGLHMPAWQGLLNLLAATLLPRVIEAQVDPHFYGTYATWYVGGLAVLLGATALRGQLHFAWGGLVIATAEIILWEGLENLLRSGWVGMVLLVVIGHAANLGMKRSESDIDRANQASSEAAVNARRVAVALETQSKTFDEWVPNIQNLLRRVIAQKGKLSDEDRREALLLEAQLSDEVMGGDILDKRVSRAVRQARLRGVEVYLMDDGVLATLQTVELAEVRQKIVDVINEQRSGKVTVRAAFGNRWRVSIIAFERGSKIANVDWKF